MDYKRVIENDIELDIYKNKYNEIQRYLSTFGPSDFFEIVRNVGGSERRMLRLINEMCIDGILSFYNGKFILNESKEKKHSNYLCNKCNGKRIIIDEFSSAIDKLKEIWNKKPKPTLIFDQRPVTLNTTINRVAYLLHNNDVVGKKIVFLGDDDLTSIALALTNKDCEIIVFDIDRRLIKFINDIAKGNDLSIEAYELNVLDNIPNKYKNFFDVLMTDPTPEAIPFTIFMNAAVNLVNKNSGIIYTSIYSTAMAKTLKLQKIITNMGLYISEIIPNFTEYQAIYSLYSNNDIELLKKYNIDFDENSICFMESLFRLEVTSEIETIEIKYKGKDVFGKATKRVIQDLNKDVANNVEDKEYIEEVAKNMINSSEKEFISK